MYQHVGYIDVMHTWICAWYPIDLCMGSSQLQLRVGVGNSDVDVGELCLRGVTGVSVGVMLLVLINRLLITDYSLQLPASCLLITSVVIWEG